jgi:hypothetical protein
MNLCSNFVRQEGVDLAHMTDRILPCSRVQPQRAIRCGKPVNPVSTGNLSAIAPLCGISEHREVNAVLASAGIIEMTAVPGDARESRR